MAVGMGMKGKVQVRYVTTTTGSWRTLGEMTNFNLSGMERAITDFNVFGSSVGKSRPGSLNPGTFSMEGYLDMRKATTAAGGALHRAMYRNLDQGWSMASVSTLTATYSSGISKIRFWVSTSTGHDYKGFFSSTATGCNVYVTGMEVRHEANGLASLTINGNVSDALLAWATTT